jgi:peptidoglycan hydrolase-like protein with peptidoglycan-binding domain
VQTRANWLQQLKDPLPTTVYRMETFEALIKNENWELKLPLTAHGVQITETALGAATPPAAGSRRTLVLLSPYMQGEDVRALQTAFAAKGLPIGKPDGFYGPFTAQLVREWQQVHGINETGVGPLTWKSLGL